MNDELAYMEALLNEPSCCKSDGICKILLRDGTDIKIYDERITQCCKILKNMKSAIPNFGYRKTPEVKMTQFKPKNVRFVFEKAVEYTKLLPDFKKSDEYRLCTYKFSLKKIEEMIEIADFLDCKPVSQCFQILRNDFFDENFMETLGYPYGMTDEEKDQVLVGIDPFRV